MFTADDGTQETPRSPRPSLGRSSDAHKVSWDDVLAKKYIHEFSTLKSLRDCGAVWLPKQRTWKSCREILCEFCYSLRAKRAAAELRALASGYPCLLFMSTSLSTTASTPLQEIWDALTEVTAEFHGSRWLRSRVAAYRLHTELTKGVGWNPHNNYVMAQGNPLDPSNFEKLKAEVAARFSSMAAGAGYEGRLHIEPILRTPDRLIGYVTKGPMGEHGDSRTAGVIFRDAALLHDAEAGADWIEIEQASRGRTWQATGGEWRSQRAPVANFMKTEPVRDLLDPAMDPPVPESKPFTGTHTDRRSDDRREATRRHWDRYAPHTPDDNAPVPTWVSRAALNREIELENAQYLASLRAPVPVSAVTYNDFADLLD